MARKKTATHWLLFVSYDAALAKFLIGQVIGLLAGARLYRHHEDPKNGTETEVFKFRSKAKAEAAFSRLKQAAGGAINLTSLNIDRVHRTASQTIILRIDSWEQPLPGVEEEAA